MELELAFQLLIALINQAGVISQEIQAAKANGQTELTPDQWMKIKAADDAAGVAFDKAIADATPHGV